MNFEEYMEKRKEIIDQYNKKIKTLETEYALSSNLVKVGDIVCDSKTCIKVELIELIIGKVFSVPECVYIGKTVTKFGNLSKNSKTKKIYQTDLKKINYNEVMQN